MQGQRPRFRSASPPGSRAAPNRLTACCAAPTWPCTRSSGRAAVAEVVKDMPSAPRALIVRLAHDTEISVSEPVIRLSPLLMTEDLLALVTKAPAPGATLAVARRAQLDEDVSDAIAASADS